MQEEYVLVAQDQVEVTVFRRSENWRAEVKNQMADQLHLASIGFAMPLAEVYESAWPPK